MEEGAIGEVCRATRRKYWGIGRRWRHPEASGDTTEVPGDTQRHSETPQRHPETPQKRNGII